MGDSKSNWTPPLDPADRKTWPGKGRSGEPRMTKEALREKMQSMLPEVIDELFGLMMSPKSEPWVKVQLGQWFNEMVLGKPKQAVTGADGGPIKISVDELRQKLEALATSEVPSEIGPHRPVLALAEPVDADVVEPAGDAAGPPGGDAPDAGAARKA